MLGLYIPRASPIHRLPAAVKLLTLACAGVGLFWMRSVAGLLVALGVVTLGAAVARLPPRQVAQQLRPLMPVLLGILLLHGWATTWEAGVAVVLRFVVLVLLAAVVSLTTQVTAMMDVLERSLRPLVRFGVPVDTVTLILMLTVRFIPVLLAQIQEIQAAQQARGVSRPALTLWVPLLVKTLRLADQVTEALDARGYGTD
ncbi:MAG: energy-coupling factor transporter transmembrane component T family protein [Elainellaceae cyanobacterium]